MEYSKVESCHCNGEVKELELFCQGCEGLDRDPTLVRGCCAQYVLGEHGDVFDLLHGGPEDALLEVHLNAEVLTHMGGRSVVALGGVDVEAQILHDGEVSSLRRMVSLKPFAKTTKGRSLIIVRMRRRRSYFFFAFAERFGRRPGRAIITSGTRSLLTNTSEIF